MTLGFRGWWREVLAASVFEWGKEGDGRGNHDLGTRLSKMLCKLQKYPHQFELAALSSQG